MFERSINSHILKDPEGKLVFYPCYGIGKGYFIGTIEQGNKVRQFMGTQYLIFWSLIVFVWSIKLISIALPIFVAEYFIWKKLLLRDMELSSMQFSEGKK